jgi:hypothetical protein
MNKIYDAMKEVMEDGAKEAEGKSRGELMNSSYSSAVLMFGLVCDDAKTLSDMMSDADDPTDPKVIAALKELADSVECALHSVGVLKHLHE